MTHKNNIIDRNRNYILYYIGQTFKVEFACYLLIIMNI